MKKRNSFIWDTKRILSFPPEIFTMSNWLKRSAMFCGYLQNLYLKKIKSQGLFDVKLLEQWQGFSNSQKIQLLFQFILRLIWKWNWNQNKWKLKLRCKSKNISIKLLNGPNRIIPRMNKMQKKVKKMNIVRKIQQKKKWICIEK